MDRTPDSKRVLALCDAVLEQHVDQRAEFLSQQCAGDENLRRTVDSVLVAVSDSDQFLGASSVDTGQSMLGQQIGDYIITRQLAEGGMGTVFLATRQGDDFDQQVAIKMVRRQFLAKETLQRFNAERKILASLQHAYIAQLIDGGTTDDGTPYLVMEYVQGQPIDEYCDANRLAIPERLRLIQKIALAVQAAHQNLIVHRDLKPSNVLVTRDGIPKLLDFGIAKLVDPAANSASNTTIFGHQAMTPDYASPEQILEARVTTVSDVYSLGVMSYQLLVGEQPYQIGTSNFREIVRLFEALKIDSPSARLESLEPESAERIATLRDSTVDRLTRKLSGDLDRVIAKAMQMDPQRRYESVRVFSDDIGRYLDDMPIIARDDTLRYRVTKFVTRNKFSVGAATTTLIAIMAGLGAALWQANVAHEQLQRAEAVSEYLGDILLSPSNNWDASLQTGADATISEVLEAAEKKLDGDLTDYPAVRAELYLQIGEARSRMENHEAAIRIIDKALQLIRSALPPASPLLPKSLHLKGFAQSNAGRPRESVDTFQAALTAANHLSTNASLLKLYILNDAASAYRDVGNLQRALAMQLQAVDDSFELFGEGLLPIHTNGYNNLAIYQLELGQIEAAEESLILGLSAHATYPEQTSKVGGYMHLTKGRLRGLSLHDEEAARSFQEAVDLILKAFDADHKEVAYANALLARVLIRLGKIDAADDIIERISRFDEGTLKDPSAWTYYLAKASMALAQGDADAAIRDATAALTPSSIKLMRKIDRADAHLLLSQAYFDAGQPEDADREYDRAMQIVDDWLGIDSHYGQHVAALKPGN